MIGLDTNVLIRLLVDDDPRQGKIARDFVAAAVRSGDRLRVDPIVLCEVVWVLRAAYHVPKPRILDVLEGLLSAAELEIGDTGIARQALEAFRNGRGDFADYMIARRNVAAGCDDTATFDRILSRDPSFRVLAPRA